MRSFPENLRLYARLTVGEGLALVEGQELLVWAEPEQLEFVHFLAEEAYRIGARHVEVFMRDPDLARIRMREGSEAAIGYAPAWLLDGVARAHREGAARLGLAGGDPELLAGFPAERVAASARAHAKAAREVMKLVADMEINWCLIAVPTAAWARKVFPGLPQDEGLARLWDAVFSVSRVFESDPLAAWRSHSETLEGRVRWLDDLRLDALHFRGPGTDLRVGLVEDHLWAGVRALARNGIRCSGNIPTEEVFTMPHRSRVEGRVVSTKPLSLRGQLVDGIEVVFKNGEVVDAHAAVGEDVLRELISTDDGARRLGEVALVPASSAVARTGLLFFDSLFDENAASHIALGESYAENLAGSEAMNEAARLDRGANSSLVHVDWMIGSAQVDVDGIARGGSTIPLMRGGEWV